MSTAKIQETMENFKNAFAKVKADTDELKPEIKAERFKEKIRPLVFDAYRQFDGEKADLKRRAANISATIKRTLETPQPDSEAKQVMQLLRAQEIRRGIEALPVEGRFQKLTEKASGPEGKVFLDAIQTAPFQIVDDHIVAAMKNAVLNSAANNNEAIKIAIESDENLRGEAEILRFETQHAEKTIRQLLQAEQISSLQEPVKMSDVEKSEYISKNGIESFKTLFDSGIR